MIDLLALGDSSALDALLIRLLKPHTPIKAGCGIVEDIAALARSYPSLQAFQACSGLLDLRSVFAQHVSATGLSVKLTHRVLCGHLLRCQRAVCKTLLPCSFRSTFDGRVSEYSEPLLPHVFEGREPRHCTVVRWLSARFPYIAEDWCCGRCARR